MNKVSDSFIKAVQSISEVQVQADPADIHVPGYGMVSPDRAWKEAQVSAEEALKHSKAGNHGTASHHLKRAAMFHDALNQK